MTSLRAWLAGCACVSLAAMASFSALAKDDGKLLHERTPTQQPALQVLGSGHFDDVLAERRQKEIASVVEQWASFKPTHIAVEWPSKSQSRLDARYRDFRESRYQLGRAEEDQLGLRLAAKLGHARVHAVDWNEEPPGTDRPQDRILVIYGQSHAYLLRQFATESRAFRLVDVDTVLKNK